MKLNIEKSVTVITPTIVSPKLADAIESVAMQTYGNLRHLIVADGFKYYGQASDFIGEVYSNLPEDSRPNIDLMFTHDNTGSNGFYGHRIYAGVPHLINSDYIFFLDEDNWYEPDHVKTLVDVLETGQDFAYSFRKIYTPDKQYVCDDNCEALGKWPIFFAHDNPQYLVDTSAFAFRYDFLIHTSQFWHSGWGGDRRYLSIVKDNARWQPSKKHTLCYRLDGNDNSVKADFFIKGNKIQLEHYKGELPWNTN